MYHSVKSSRLSPITGKPLYDRYLTDFGHQYLRSTFDNRVRKEINKYSEFSQMHMDDTKKFSNLDFVKTALYKLVYRHLDLSSLVDSVLIDGNLSVVSDVDFAFELWSKNKDTCFLKHYKPCFLDSALCSDPDVYHEVQSMFADSHYFLSFYEATSFAERKLVHENKKIKKLMNGLNVCLSLILINVYVKLKFYCYVF